MRTLPLWVAAVWAFSLATLGFFVVPMLFLHLPTPAMAGAMAAKLFSMQTWVSVSCGMALLAFFRSARPLVPLEIAQTATLIVLAGVLLAVLVEFVVAPRIVARDNLVLWHRLGSLMYFAQWMCALLVFRKLASTGCVAQS